MQNDNAFFASLVEEQYEVQEIQLHSLSQYSFDWRGIYRVEHGGNQSWLLRACRQDGVENWLLKPAATLLFLEQQGYPAPRVVRTLSGELVGTVRQWWTLMLTYVEGSQANYSLESLRMLGSITAQLHMLHVDASTSITPPIRASWKHPQEAGPECLRLLDSVRDKVPSALQIFYNQVVATLEHIQQATNLPITIIHGDCWPGNAVQAPDGNIVLIDWDGAGYGPPVLDIGALLLTSHFGQPHYPQITPDPSLISAVVEGYCQHRTPTSAELAMLVEAVRFNSAFHFARDCQSVLQDHIGLQKLRMRYDAAEEIALIARQRFEQFA